MIKRAELNQEAIEIYTAMKTVMAEMNTDYCQSWWLNTKNFDLKSKLSTPKINQRCKLLIKQGYLSIDKSRTSTSMGICYRFTDKYFDAIGLSGHRITVDKRSCQNTSN